MIKRDAEKLRVAGGTRAVELARAAGVDRRIVVRRKTGTRVVRPGEPLDLQPDEVILQLPIGVARAALRRLAQDD